MNIINQHGTKSLIEGLRASPSVIADAQSAYDAAAATFAAAVQEVELAEAKISKAALEGSTFNGKDGAKRPASNDEERKIAIALAMNSEMVQSARRDRDVARAIMSEAFAALELAKNEQRVNLEVLRYLTAVQQGK